MAIETDAADLLNVITRKPDGKIEDTLDVRPRLHEIGLVFADLMIRGSTQLILRNDADRALIYHDLRYFTHNYAGNREPLFLLSHEDDSETRAEEFEERVGSNGLIVVENVAKHPVSSELTAYIGELARNPDSAMICSVEAPNDDGESQIADRGVARIANLATSYVIESSRTVVPVAWARKDTGR